ncbi:P-loop NTPase [Acidothermaceae bacterium B102]|nr:P-loop NTPase [Acidothermaceae bacterium B102]
MRLPVVTAVVDARWEAGLVSAFEQAEHNITVVRRCVDLADLLATAATGTARAALLSADLRRLDRDALVRLAAHHIAVVGLVPPGDEDADRRLRQLGVRFVLPADAAASVISAAVAEAVASLDGAADPVAVADPMAMLPREPRPPSAPPAELVPGTGRVIAVWGPTGAPGRTTVAVTLASEIAAAGQPTLLIDADVYGGVVSQLLGLLEEAPGIAAAARMANNGSLDVAALSALCRQVAPSLRVLTGITRADRWPELRGGALEVVLALARTIAAVVVVDLGFCLEQDEELSYDTTAPRRNGATLTVLEQADTVVAVAAADPVGLQRFVRGYGDLREVLAGVEPVVVVNKVRTRVVPGDPVAEIAAALVRYVGVGRIYPVAYDRGSVDTAVAHGRSLTESASGSPARKAIAGLAADLVGTASQHRAHGHGRRRRAVR